MSTFFALAALVTAPILDQTFSSAIQQEYPLWAVRDEKSAGAIISIWVDPTGRIYDCKVLSVMGDKRLAAEVCGLSLRWKVPPAIDRHGKPIFGNVVTLIRVAIPDTPMGDRIRLLKQASDLELDLNKLPDKLESPYKLGLALEIDPDGRIVTCNGDKNANEMLAHVACERVASELFEKAFDKERKPISYVRPLKVTFSVTDTAKR